jgi:hypothetical protein
MDILKIMKNIQTLNHIITSALNPTTMIPMRKTSHIWFLVFIILMIDLSGINHELSISNLPNRLTPIPDPLSLLDGTCFNTDACL